MQKISIFTTVTNPEERQDPYNEAIANYMDFADEVVVVDGSGRLPDGHVQSIATSKGIMRWVHYKWPDEFDWTFIGQQFNRGLDECTGDWAIRMDIDYFIHENDFKKIRNFLKTCDAPVVNLLKKQFLLANQSRIKAKLPIIINRRHKDTIKLDSGGDLCQPSINGKELDKDALPICDAMIWNYDFTFKEKEVIQKDFPRFARAWYRTFKEYGLGKDDKSAFEYFVNMQIGRYKSQAWNICEPADHPKHIQEKIKNLKPEQFGYNMWGLI